MVKSWGVAGGGPLDYTVSYLGQVIVIVIGRPRSLTIVSISLFLIVFETFKRNPRKESLDRKL